MNADERGLEKEMGASIGDQHGPCAVSILLPAQDAASADERKSWWERTTERIIGGAFTVSNRLGCGFLEKVYENALTYELRKQGLRVEQQLPILVRYDDVVVGEYSADLLVEERILVELKAVKTFDDVHAAQCLNYLKATNLTLCLLINFGKPSVEIKRIVNKF